MGEQATQAAPRILLGVFLGTLLLPIFFHVGDLRLSPYRIFLLVAFLPLLLRLALGRAGRIAPGDIFMGLHCLWICVALYMNHGAERIPFAGITAVELLGGYLAGRVLIRSAADYRIFFRYFTVALAILLPLAVIEMLTGRMLISEALSPIAETFPKVLLEEQRMGFYRAQGVLEHSILWGVFCSVAIANLFYLFQHRLPKAVLLSGFVTGMTFTSLSAAPLLSALLQFGMIGWGWVTRNAWWTLAILGTTAYVAIDLASNRTPVAILIDYATFNAHNAWIRIHIWNYGSAEALNNPVFGIGLGDWQRPYWLPASVDNFWLVAAMRYGLPGLGFLALAIAANLFLIMRKKLPENLRPYRLAYVVAALGLFMTLGTVHIWGATSVFVMFYIGAGSWLFAAPDAPDGAEEAEAAQPVRGARIESRTSRPAKPVAARRTSGAVLARSGRPGRAGGPAEPEAEPGPGREGSKGSPPETGTGRSPTREEILARRRAAYGRSRL